MSDLLEDVHAQIRGQVRDCLSTEVGQRHLCEGLSAQRFTFFIAFQTHVLKNTAEGMVNTEWTS